MSSLLVQIADALVTALNGHSFSQAFTAVRRYVPKFNIEELATLRVSVVMNNPTYAPLSRSRVMTDWTVSVGLQKALDTKDNTAADAMVGLCEEIVAFLNNRHMAGASWVGTDCLAVYDPTQMDGDGVFTAVYAFRYKT